MTPPVNRIRQLEKKRSQYLNALLRSQPLLKGSLLNLKRPCGRSPCCCEQGKLHQQMIVSFKKEGKTKFIYVPKEDQVALQRLAGNRKQFRKHKRKMTSVEKKVWKEIQKLEHRITTRYKR